MKLYDSHTHLNTEPLLQDWKLYLQKFIDAGGAGLVNSWASESYNVQAIEIAKQTEGYKMQDTRYKNIIVKATLGWHPSECVEWNITLENIPAKMQWLKELCIANTPYVVGIGETGIDMHYPNSLETLEIQKQLFIEHCNLARELDLPVVIHSRDDFETTFEILKNYTDLVVYFHCRGYGTEEIQRLKDLKIKRLFFWFCGNVTYKNAQALRDSLFVITSDQILLETDAPYLTPQVIRGETNHPANVQYIYEYVVQFLKMDVEELSLLVEKNFKEVYGL
ncbi:MAG: hypothetical protein ACD_80C00037G0002 [uncultured bacterium (gcode 4)]|uniref:Uncharacterized protein n=1 Tax=uncultured bacterium (gcode 4) TaxID=1234023 RepID=K1X5N3_9BACT|nr:MAG: hypothetical protein ACD_80C00037G0002 [uncultured bacterium (gcode 4)]